MGILGNLSSHCRGLGPHLELNQKLQVPLELHGNLRDPLVFPLGSQVSFRAARGSAGLLSSNCRGIGPHLKMRWEHRALHQLCQVTWGSSRVVTGLP